MAFRVVRLRREARRNAKLDEIFAVRESEIESMREKDFDISGER